jgi:hypothetical protein
MDTQWTKIKQSVTKKSSQITPLTQLEYIELSDWSEDDKDFLALKGEKVHIAYSSDFCLFICISFSMDMRFTLGLDPGCQQGCRLRDPYGSFTCGRHGRGILAIIKRDLYLLTNLPPSRRGQGRRREKKKHALF